MNQWLNRSHPQTLQAGVILGYISAVFGMLLGAPLFVLPIFIGLGVGAFATANNKRWGYFLLAICACLAAAFRLLFVFVGVSDIINSGLIQGIRSTLTAMNGSVFPVALAVAVLHLQSREYQKVWFE